MKFEHIILKEKSKYVYELKLNRPKVRNALNTKMAIEIFEAVSAISKEKARALIITGSGDKAFCAGADLKERATLNMKEWKKQHTHFEALVGCIEEASFPVIASVNGAAFGGGLEIILACDFAYARAGQKFSFSEVNLGIIPGLGGIYRLAKAVGAPRAKELVETARVFMSEEAKSWGVVNEVFADFGELEKESLNTAKLIAQKAPLAVSAAKQALNLSNGEKLSNWTKKEHELYYSLVESKDREEGVKAFNEKRQAEFCGE